MSNVVPFEPRPSAGGGWTAAERARLSDLADRLSASGAKVEVVYGMTDEGDPWCVIKDENEEVLIHVARINGQFVIHDAS
ncbi:MAG: calcium-binding protein, partial [Phenylobacterium sp.]|nr:calcium-binding protein [Phenylobacterium sp.]